MSQAQIDLQHRLICLRASLQEAAVSDGAPTDTTKNAVAAMMRSGLAVLTFATLEAFIRDRTGEILKGFAVPTVTFSDLSEKLQNAVTLSALQGILYRGNQQEKSARVSWVLAELPAVANAATNIAYLSPYSFGQSNSNISEDVVPQALSAFGIDGGWSAISQIAKHVGLGGIADYSQAFKEVAKRRHAAAHDVSINIPLADLQNGLVSVLGICCSFDLLLSHSLSRHNIGKSPTLVGVLRHGDLKFRFISPHPSKLGQYREQTRNGPATAPLHTTLVHADLATAVSAVSSKISAKQEQLIILGANGLPEKWITWNP